MEFTYAGVDKDSIKQKGKLQANSEKEVVDFLRSNSITPLSIKKVQTSKGFLFFNKLKSSDIILFTRQLASMVQTGLTLIEALKILKQQTSNQLMQELVTNLIAQISEGAAFSDALAQHDDIFPPVYIALIRAAEKGGLLDKALARLADNLENSDDLKKRIKGAMFYPAIVVVGMVVVIGVMNVFVIPQLASLYTSLNVQLPLTTQIVLAMSKGFTTFYPIFIVLGIIFVVSYNRFKKTEEGHKVIDKVKLKIPVIGSIMMLSILDEIVRTLSILISSGTSIIESLNITADVADSYWYKKAVLSTCTLVEKGVTLSDALDHQNIFPVMLVQMVKVGESTGKIDESLLKLSEYFERDLDVKVKTLATAIEPILIIILGVSVAFLILSIITPIYGLISQIQ